MSVEPNPNQEYLYKCAERFRLMIELHNIPTRHSLANQGDDMSGNPETVVDELRRKIEAMIEEEDAICAKEGDGSLELRNLANRLSLSRPEMDAFLLRLTIEEVPGFERRCIESFGDMYPVRTSRMFLEDLLYTFHGSGALAAFEETSPLFRSGLIEYLPGDPSSRRHMSIKINHVAALLLLGKDIFMPNLTVYAADFQAPKPYQSEYVNPPIVNKLTKARDNGERAVIELNGPPGTGKNRLVRYLCASAHLPLYEINVDKMLHLPDGSERITNLLRSSRLMRYAVLLTGISDEKQETGKAPKNAIALIARELRAEGMLAFISAEHHIVPGGMDDFTSVIDLSAPDIATREQIWTDALEGRKIAQDVSIANLAGTFHLSGAPLYRAIQYAAGQAVLREAPTLTNADLIHACRRETTGRMKELAVLVQPRFTWDDLIMNNQTKSLLGEVQNAIVDRRVVYDEWVMHAQGTAERGMSILFTGPPGTGKTMAASIIARELGLELYKLDLSRVVSKYVGETEKNLSIIFDEAERANAVLFFDEADSLFGKRGDIKSAQDHYVNQQVGFLLQKVESFQGVAFLATNLDENMDKAFERRFNHIIRFRVPKAPERTEIWKRSFSDVTPLSDEIDFAALGKEFNISGAQIKNIARNAAFLAVADKSRDSMIVTQKDILHAALREFDKETIAWEMDYSGPFKEDLTRIRTVLKGD